MVIFFTAGGPLSVESTPHHHHLPHPGFQRSRGSLPTPSFFPPRHRVRRRSHRQRNSPSRLPLYRRRDQPMARSLLSPSGPALSPSPSQQTNSILSSRFVEIPAFVLRQRRRLRRRGDDAALEGQDGSRVESRVQSRSLSISRRRMDSR